MGREADKLKRAIHTPEEAAIHEDDESIWLLSYADLMTLMFTFFVMLYASLLQDDTQALRRTLSNFVTGNGEGVNAGASDSAVDLKRSLTEKLEEEQLLREVQVTLNKNGLKLTFSSNLLFDLGASELRAESEDVLKRMSKVILSKAPGMKVRIEGHTDDNPIRTGRFKTNWELSGARAAHIASLFEKQGFNPTHLIAIGYGESRPLKPNRTPAGAADVAAQQANRRVIITLYEPIQTKTKEPHQTEESE